MGRSASAKRKRAVWVRPKFREETPKEISMHRIAAWAHAAVQNMGVRFGFQILFRTCEAKFFRPSAALARSAPPWPDLRVAGYGGCASRQCTMPAQRLRLRNSLEI